MDELSKDNLLRSWKEISAYLGCDIRTCHRWEDKRGLPVHRAEGGETKSPVFAYRDELDAWFRDTFRDGNHAKDKAAKGKPWLKWAAAGTAVLVLAGAFLLSRAGGTRRQPADFAIDGSFFVVLDKQKRELWRKDTGYEDLFSEGEYRANFQVMHPVEANILPILAMRDINGDGDTEVLFAPRRTSDQTGEGFLYCYDHNGTELWNFPCGRELKCGSKRFSPDYRIAGFYVHDIDGDGRLETVVESFQAPDWPCQLALLDSSGKKIGEFWNAGYLRQLTYKDINGDGRAELIVCGVNNEYRGGCLIVFDTRKISGSSPQSGEFVCEGLKPGSELYYVTTPYADVSEAMRFAVEGLRLIDITGNNWIRARTSNDLIYEFDFGLDCMQVSGGHGYKIRHDDMVKAGKITSVIGDDYMRRFKEGVRYWNGSAWTSEPSMNRR